MSTDQPSRRGTSGSGGAPVGSAAAIVIAVIAVVGGFLILRQIQSDDTTATVPETTLAPTTTPVPEVVPTTLPPETVPTTAPQTFEGATVVVANASNVNGAAGRLSLALEGKGFTMAEATNANERLETSVVYYNAANPNALAVATTAATLMGGVSVAEAPTPAPIEGGALPDGVDVLVLLGSDKADKTLDAMGVPTTTVAAADSTTTAPA